jgi:hypothetical protein
MRSVTKLAETEFWLSGITWDLVPASVTKGPNLPGSQ